MRAREEGFTLLELLLVMTITSILILGMNAAYRQAYHLWVQVEGQRDVYTRARLLSDTLRTELAGLYLPPLEAVPESQGIEYSFQLLPKSNHAVELAFFTLTPAWHGSVESSRSARVRYRFTSDAGTGRGLLERFEQLCAGGKILGSETRATVAADLADLQLWIADPNDARESLKTTYESSQYPPKALKVVIAWLGSHEVPANSFEMLIQIPCDKRLYLESADEG